MKERLLESMGWCIQPAIDAIAHLGTHSTSLNLATSTNMLSR